MEAFGDQLAGHGGTTAGLTRAVPPVGGASCHAIADGTADGGLAELLASANAAAAAAPARLAMASYLQASDFAGLVEDISRTVEHLQILAAGAVDRTRSQAIADAARARSARSWITGWDNGTETLNETDAAWPAGSVGPPGSAGSQSPAAVPVSPADDGCANTAEFLRVRLRIGKSEARRRLALAHDVLPATTLTGDTTGPRREHLATALTPTTRPTDTHTDTDAMGSVPVLVCPTVSSRAGTIISLTLDQLQHRTTAETLTRIEQDLTRTAATADPDFLTRVARRWTETLDADGTEPSEEALRHTQGAFIRKPRHGLHHLEIFATTTNTKTSQPS